MIFDYSSLLLLLFMLKTRPALGAGIGSSLSSSVSTSIIGDIWGGTAIPPDAGTTVIIPFPLKQQAKAVIYNLHMFPFVKSHEKIYNGKKFTLRGRKLP